MALLWVGMILLLAMAWLGSLTMPELKTDAQSHLDEVDTYFTSIDKSFADLKAVDGKTCDSSVLRRFQREMFINTYLREIYLFKEGTTVPECTVTMGILDNAAALPQSNGPDLFHPGREVWFALPLGLFDGQKAAYTIRDGRIGLASTTETVEAPVTRNLWQTYFPPMGPTGAFFHIAGQDGLHQKYLDQQGALISTSLIYDGCAKSLPSCITVATTWPIVFARNRTFINIAILLAIITGMMVYYFVRRWLSHRGAPVGRLASALRRKRGFTCVYQPVVELSSGTPLGCEVLARFEDSLGTLSPAEFVPIILNMGKTWEFTEIILSRALDDLKPVLDLNKDFKVAVNFYPQDLCEGNLGKIEKSKPINRAIEQGIRLNFEVLETGLADASDMRVVLNYIHARGFKVSIDDFGTGSSNLHQLRAIQPNFIKVDRSFISGLSADSSSVRSSLVHHIVEIANEMKVEIVAEGVESFTQLQVLSGLGIRYAQGYFFSPPVSVERLMDFVRTEEALEGVRSLQQRVRALG